MSRGLQAKTRASPIIRKWLVLTLFGVAARIGANVVARLANILDIGCIERLASTNSGPQRTCVSLCYGLLVLAAAPAVWAQASYPSKPIRLIVPYPPGGSTEYTARELAQKLTAAWGQQVVIDSRGGAGSIIGHGVAAHSLPDGYTLLLGTSAGLAIAPAIGTKLPYDPAKDFAPIGLAVYVPYVLVLNASIAATNMKEFIDLAKAQPGKFNFGSSGPGTPNHLGGEMLNVLAGIRMVHVAYKGGGPALIDLLGGQIQLMFSAIPQTLPHVKTGRLKAIAVGHPTRTRALPDLPAVAETLPGFSNTTVYGLLAPAGTPRAIVAKINAEMNKALNNPEFAQRLLIQGGVEAVTSTPEGMAEVIRSETARWRMVIQSAGISPSATQ